MQILRPDLHHLVLGAWWTGGNKCNGFPCDISLGQKVWDARSIAAELPGFSHLGGDILPGHDCVDGLFALASLNRQQGWFIRAHHAKKGNGSLLSRFWVVFVWTTCDMSWNRTGKKRDNSWASIGHFLPFQSFSAPVRHLYHNWEPWASTAARLVFAVPGIESSASTWRGRQRWQGSTSKKHWCSQLSSTKKNEQEHLSLSLAHVQLWLRLSNLGTLSICGRLSSLWSMTQLQHQRSCGALRGLRVAKLQEVLGQFHDVQVTFTSQATLSKAPGLLDISWHVSGNRSMVYSVYYVPGGRCFLPQAPRSYPIPMAHRVTPVQPEVTPGTKSYWHTGTTPSLVWQTKY